MAPAVRTGLAGLLIVVASLLVAALIGAVLRSLMVAVKLSTEDRLLGGIFGLLRGVLVVGALVLFAGLTAAPAQTWWRESLLLPRLQAAVQWLQPWLPASLFGTAQGL
jgi:membrane protein required for colicin V production